MMIDPIAIAQGVSTGYIVQKGVEKANEVMHPGDRSPQDDIIDLLREIRDGVNPPAKDVDNESMLLQGYPSEYIIPDDFRGHSHACVFFYTQTPVRFDGTFGGSYLAVVGPGWKQLDVPGRLSTSDGSSHAVVVSYREDALGSTF